MGCVASTDKKDAESMAIAERIVLTLKISKNSQFFIFWSIFKSRHNLGSESPLFRLAQHDQDGNGVLDMNEVRAYVHANVAQMNKKGMLIDN